MRNTLYILLLLLYPISCLQAGGGNGKRGSQEEKPEARKVVILKTFRTNQEVVLSEKEVDELIDHTVLHDSSKEARIARAGKIMNLW